MTKKSPSLATIAKECGVSISCVSKILNGATEFSESTRAQVLRVTAELNYVPNRVGKSLQRGVTATIALFYTAPIDRFVEKLFLRAQEFFAQRGFTLIGLPLPQRIKADPILETMRSGICDGAIVACDDETRASLLDAGDQVLLPTMVIGHLQDRRYDDAQLPRNVMVIDTDEHAAVKQLLDYLHYAGCAAIGYVGPLGGYARYQAYSDWSERAGLTATAFGAEVQSIPMAFKLGMNIFNRDATMELDALYCASDRIALGMALAAEALGLEVPGQIAIAGTGASQDGAEFDPPLTTIGLSVQDIDESLQAFLTRLQEPAFSPSVISQRWRIFARATTPLPVGLEPGTVEDNFTIQGEMQ